jgi:hypothetical protein
VPNHPQTLIEHAGMQAEVDREMASLILDLWRLGLRTVNSCQDNFGKVWIEFAGGGEAEAFASIAAGEFVFDANALYSRVLGWGEADDPELVWLYDAIPDDGHVQWIGEHPDQTPKATGSPLVTFTVSVRFPRSDLREVERRVRARTAR